MMATEVASLEVQGLSKSFGALRALHSVSFSVRQGERRAIIGPNGAGKTTLFSLISGTMSPSSGRIFLGGHDITGLPPERRAFLGLARTFQVTNLFPNLTLLDNIMLGIQARLPMKHVLWRPRSWYRPLYHRAQELLETWSLWERRNVQVRNLSYGQQRQVEILLALAGEPRVLLLDEPTAGLSAAETTSVTSLIRALDSSITVLLIEHDMDVAFGLVDRMTVFHLGQVLADGPPQQIRADPRVTEIYLGEEAQEMTG